MAQRVGTLGGISCGVEAFHVQLDAGQRRAQLVRGISDEPLLQAEHIAHARKKVVDGPGEGEDLDRDVVLTDRAEVVSAPAQARGQWFEDAQAMAYAEPHQAQHGHDQQGLHGQGEKKDFARTHVPVAQALGHGDGQEVAGFVAAAYPHDGGAQGFATEGGIVEARRPVGSDGLVGAGQFGIADKPPVPVTENRVVVASVRIVFEEEARLGREFAA